MASKRAGKRARARLAGAALVIVAVSIAGILGCNGDDQSSADSGSVPGPGPDTGLGVVVECQHEWDNIYAGNSPADGLAGVDSITNIPEFHDCQKLLRADGQYGPLIAVFAAWELDSLDIKLARESGYPVPAKPADMRLEPGALTDSTGSAATGGTSQPPATEATTQGQGTTKRIGRLGALIVNFDEEYVAGDLVIKPGYNCLYLWLAPRWNARIVSVQDDDQCLQPLLPDEMASGGVPLTVKEDWSMGGNRTDYPPVARWDYDPGSKQHYIGIKCGAAWCEVGSSNFQWSARYHQQASVPEEIRRVRRIKGWYDEQFLAVAQSDPSLPASASTLKGTLIPHPELGVYTVQSFTGTWVPVAYVALAGGQPSDASHYKTKANLELAAVTLPFEGLNRVEMCFGTFDGCTVVPDTTKKCFSDPQIKTGERWWARTTAATSKEVKYRCVVRRAHPPMSKHVPGTARWRWVLMDETKWARCDEGCCEVDNSAQ